MKKGFTLIELLAVIVILAIIALIATPIILGIISDAREESNERSVELYASAVRNGIAAYQLRTGNSVLPGTYTTLPFEVEYDGKVDCENVIISETGKVSLDKCTVNNGEKTYNYGMEEDETPDNGEIPDSSSTQVYKPQYYWFEIFESGNIGEELPSSAKQKVSDIDTQDHPFYIGLDVDSSNKVSAAYACFTRNETEYCLMPNDFDTNTDIIKDAFSDVVDTDACDFDDGYYGYYECGADGLYAHVSSSGLVKASGGSAECRIYSDGTFQIR